jgi:hypothetical protein
VSAESTQIESPSGADSQGIIKIDGPPSPAKEAEVFDEADYHSKKIKNDSLKQDIAERKKYADFAKDLTSRWVWSILILTAAQMVLRCWDRGLKEAEFIAFLTTTTASVFGFWWLVGRYLFKGPDKPEK